MEVAVIGGGAAGMTAASRIKAINPGWRVVVFEKSQFVSHAPCGIPFYVSGFVEQFKDLCTYSVDFFRSEREIDVRTNTKVVEVGENYLIAENIEKSYEYEWDKLLFATGAKADFLGVEGENLEGVFHVDVENAQKIKKNVLKAENIVIVGSGYIGVEMTEAVLRLGKRPTVIEIQERPLPEYDAEIAAILKVEMEKYVNLKLSETVVAFEGKDKVEKLITNKNEYKCDLAILAVGMRPNSEIAKKIVKLGKKNAIKTDSRMRTSLENVFAAGDCAEVINIVTGKPDWIPLAAPANKTGYVAGVNMAGKDLEYPGSLKSQITSFFELEIGKVGLSEHEAIKEGFETVSAFVTSRTAARYLPDGLIHLKVVADRSGKLLGFQAIGKGVIARIYAASALLYNKCNIKDLFFTDFPYYPPISRVWDPLVVAARNLFRKVGLP
ncbi:MAG: FAD-dependent oxidoreductase [Archaeoglobaceae archaeon]|nr:FAD-dependent oxidoreductase [Archaeoglobaceae archaeon]MCX8152641.1 FAD-dependent oxidoreductase [Archaeoglobaceae archaeon]MDW8014077.1 FAD-dependent oxidoreductase [Archaeoglobaceae archaeon]